MMTNSDPEGQIFLSTAQMALVHCISRSQRQKIDFRDKNFKNFLV